MTDMNEIVSRVTRDLAKQLDDKIKAIVLEYAEPKIKGEITKGKIKHRGIRICQQNLDWDKVVYWVEQRGKQIGPKIEFNALMAL